MPLKTDPDILQLLRDTVKCNQQQTIRKHLLVDVLERLERHGQVSISYFHFCRWNSSHQTKL